MKTGMTYQAHELNATKHGLRPLDETKWNELKSMYENAESDMELLNALYKLQLKNRILEGKYENLR